MAIGRSGSCSGRFSDSVLSAADPNTTPCLNRLGASAARWGRRLGPDQKISDEVGTSDRSISEEEAHDRAEQRARAAPNARTATDQIERDIGVREVHQGAQLTDAINLRRPLPDVADARIKPASRFAKLGAPSEGNTSLNGFADLKSVGDADLVAVAAQQRVIGVPGSPTTCRLVRPHTAPPSVTRHPDRPDVLVSCTSVRIG